MNKQEFIERIKSLKNIFGNKCEYVEIDAVIELASELDEPQKVTVPQFVADWYEECKDDFETGLFQCIYEFFKRRNDNELTKFEEWIIDCKTEPFQTLVNMRQFGYTVEEEKRYLVKMKGIRTFNGCLKCNADNANWFFSGPEECAPYRAKHTRQELEDAGFGWVFDCPGIEIEEVEE